MLERYRELVAGRQRLVWFVCCRCWSPSCRRSAPRRSGGTGCCSGTAADFGTSDPQFGPDIGFYVFKLPFLSLVVDWLFGFLLVTLVLVVVLYYLNGAIRLQPLGERITPNAKAHLSVILALLALVKAVRLLAAAVRAGHLRRDSFDGAGYTDVNATLPALQLLILVALFAGVLFLVNIRRKGWVLPVIILALWGTGRDHRRRHLPGVRAAVPGVAGRARHGERRSSSSTSKPPATRWASTTVEHDRLRLRPGADPEEVEADRATSRRPGCLDPTIDRADDPGAPGRSASTTRSATSTWTATRSTR